MSKLRHKRANKVGPRFAYKYSIKFSMTTTQAYFLAALGCIMKRPKAGSNSVT